MLNSLKDFVADGRERKKMVVASPPLPLAYQIELSVFSFTSGG